MPFADIEAIIESEVDRELLRTAVMHAIPESLDTLQRAFANVDRAP